MIYKVIATFQCGNKIIRNNSTSNMRMGYRLKLRSKRPVLIQVFVRRCSSIDRAEIYTSICRTLQPTKGTVTVNGMYISTFMESLQDEY